jgi:hypothetical protein
MTNLERRDIVRAELHQLEVRNEGSGLPLITGYAAVFGELSEDLGGWRERIKVGAFTRSIREGADVRALVDHDPSKILGRNKAGTLRLKTNTRGLLVEIDAPDTQAGRDIRHSIQRGDVSGMSFAFMLRRDANGKALDVEWHKEDGEEIREVVDVGQLMDVSVVTYPAYPATDVAARSLRLGLQSAERELSEFRMRLAEEAEAERLSLARRADLLKRVGG